MKSNGNISTKKNGRKSKYICAIFISILLVGLLICLAVGWIYPIHKRSNSTQVDSHMKAATMKTTTMNMNTINTTTMKTTTMKPVLIKATPLEDYNEKEYNENDYNKNDYNNNDYNEIDDNEKEYNEKEYNENDYNKNDYNEKAYNENEYNEKEYNENEYSDATTMKPITMEPTTMETTTVKPPTVKPPTVKAAPLIVKLKAGGLIHSWPMSKTGLDNIGNKNMTFVKNCEFVDDRFGNKESALLLNHGYATVPPGVYFDPRTGGYSITVWVKILSLQRWQQIIDFGRGKLQDNIMLGFFLKTTQVYAHTGIDESYKGILGVPVEPEEWSYIAFTVDDNSGSIYIDGYLVKSVNGFGNTYQNIERTKNFIGSSNFGYDLFHGVIDDLKIYDKALNIIEINEAMMEKPE